MTDTTTTTTDELDYRLDALLADWYGWRRRYTIARGYSAQDGTCKDHRSGTHFDWWNGAADARAEELQMKAVDGAMDRVPNEPRRWNTALQFQAMNLHSGAAVWTSPMLPGNAAERAVLLLEARNRLLIELRRDGIFGA